MKVIIIWSSFSKKLLISSRIVGRTSRRKFFEMEIDDAFSASLIDALMSFCKSGLRDLKVLEIVDNNDVSNFLEYIHKDNTEFIEDSDPSSVWSAIVKGFEETPVLNISRTNSSADEIVTTISDASKRAYGAFLCTAELIVEVCPRCAPTIVQSLYKVFISPILIGHSNSTSFIFSLLQDYKMYFPYAYTFCRRIGRSPTTTLQQWREYFYPRHQSQDEIQNLSQDWDMSGLEEGEDSDGEDQQSILGPPTSVINSPAMTKKRTTRMSTTTNQKRNIQKHLPHNPHHQQHSNSLSADLLVQMQSSGDGSLLEIQDLSFDSTKSMKNHSLPLQTDVEKQNHHHHNQKKEDNSSPSRFEKKITNPPSDRITIEDLRKAFSQSLEDDDSDLAEKGKLSNVLKYRYNLPSLGLRIQSFHDSEVSWDELKELASTFITKSVPMRVPDSPQPKKTLVIPTPTITSTKKDSNNDQWQDRVFHNYLVDSTDHSPNTNSNTIIDIMDMKTHVEPPRSPYLSLSKAPPPGMSAQQIGEYLFHEVDRNGSGMVSRVDLINALHRHSELTEQLNLSNRDGSLSYFTQKIQNKGSNKISLTEFMRMLHETHEERRVTRSSPHHFDQDWESENGDRGENKDIWESQEYPLNPNRISVRSDDILMNARGESPNHDRERDRDLDRDHPHPHSQSHSHSHSHYQRNSRGRDDRRTSRDSSRSPSHSPDQFQSHPPAPLSISPKITHSTSSPLSKLQSTNRPQQMASTELIRPPLHRSSSDVQRDLKQENEIPKPEKRFPSLPSELGTLMRTILEGWLEKKSSKLGIWQKRYFVLTFGSASLQTNPSNVPCIQLQIFKRAVESAWGMVPLGLTRVVDVESLSQILVVSNKKKIDTVFTLTEKIKSAEGIKKHVQEELQQQQQQQQQHQEQQPDPESLPGENNIHLVRRDSLESITSDDIWTGKSRITTLKAIDPEERLLWVNTIRRSMEICQSINH